MSPFSNMSPSSPRKASMSDFSNSHDDHENNNGNKGKDTKVKDKVKNTVHKALDFIKPKNHTRRKSMLQVPQLFSRSHNHKDETPRPITSHSHRGQLPSAPITSRSRSMGTRYLPRLPRLQTGANVIRPHDIDDIDEAMMEAPETDADQSPTYLRCSPTSLYFANIGERHPTIGWIDVKKTKRKPHGCIWTPEQVEDVPDWYILYDARRRMRKWDDVSEARMEAEGWRPTDEEAIEFFDEKHRRRDEAMYRAAQVLHGGTFTFKSLQIPDDDDDEPPRKQVPTVSMPDKLRRIQLRE